MLILHHHEGVGRQKLKKWYLLILYRCQLRDNLHTRLTVFR